VCGVFLTERTIFFQFDSAGGVFLVFSRCIVTTLAF